MGEQKETGAILGKERGHNSLSGSQDYPQRDKMPPQQSQIRDLQQEIAFDASAISGEQNQPGGPGWQ